MGQSMAFQLRALGVPVSIGPSILLGLLGLGMLSRLTGVYLVEWMLLGLIALILHELGHALAFRRYGVASSIKFFLLGGLTFPEDGEAFRGLTDRQMLVVVVAGPSVGLVVGGISLALAMLLGDVDRAVRIPLGLWTFVNLVWALFNLLPISNLDGGRALAFLAGAAFGKAGRAIGTAAGIVASGIIAYGAAVLGFYSVTVIAVLFGLVIPILSGRLAGGPGDPPNRSERS